MGRGSGARAASATSIELSFEYRGVRCREKLKLAPTRANLKFARNLKARIEHEIAVGSFDYGLHFPKSRRARSLAKNPAQTLTVGELLTEWRRQVYPQLEPETYGDYAEYVAHIWRPRFGKLRLSELTLERIYDWMAEQSSGRKRILNVLTPLRQAVRYACTAQLLAIDPIAKIRVQRPAPVGGVSIDPFSGEEIAVILAHLEPGLSNMCQFWAWTGLREGELIALSWSDIDLERGVAMIARAARGARRKAPKTAAGRREVKLLPPALEALQRQKPLTRLLHREIFLNPGTGIAWGHDKPIRNRWRAALAAAGVRYRFPRQLRHTYASWMLMAREDPMWIARQMGHRDVSITLKVYAKYIPAMNPDAGMAACRSWPNRGPA